LRVAIIGAGRMGAHHARVYSQLPHCELVAVVDADRARAEKIAADFGGRVLTDICELPDGLAAASVAVPTVYHADVAIPLLERGVAVLVEKPMAHDSATARRMLEASRRTGTILQVGHSERFNPVVQAMLRMNVTPRFIETQRVSPFTFRSADIGVVFDMMIHDIDIVLHLVNRCNPNRVGDQHHHRQRAGSPSPASDITVDAVGVAVLGVCEDVANARIRFGKEVVVNLTASRLALKTDRRIRIFCPSAYLSMDFHKKNGIAIKLADNLDLIRMAKERNFEDLSQMAHLDFGSMVKIEPLVVADVEPLKAEIESFLLALNVGDGEPASPHASSVASAEEGYAAVELAERITNAVREQDWGRGLEQSVNA
jgi:predicted dehydrogenase